VTGTGRRRGRRSLRWPGTEGGPGAVGTAAATVLAAVLLHGAPAAAGAAPGDAARSDAPGARSTLVLQEADTIPSDTAPAGPVQAVPDSVLPDSLRSVPDSLLPDSLLSDSAREVSVEERREALAGGGFPSRDSLFRRLAGESGYRIVEYRGREVELEVPGRIIRLEDSAQANYGENALRADTILYRGRSRFMEARGRIELVGSERPVRSDSVLFYDVERSKGTVYGARTQTTARGASWNVQGDAIPRGRKTLFVESGSFTSCTLREPHYRFEAGQMKLVSQDVIVAWPVVLRIGHVPVAWLPFFAQSMRPERASGILPPRFGFNDVVRTSRGMQRQVSDFGYYWAINRYLDAQATMGWFSGNYTKVGGRLRYNFMKSFIDGNVSAERSWGDGQSSLQFNWQHDQEISPNTTFRVSSQFATNTQTFRDRSFDPRDQLRRLSSDVGFNHRLPWANLSLSASRRQSISGSEDVQMTLPSLNLSFSPVTLFPAPRNRAGLFNNLTWNGSLSASRSTRTSQAGGDRLQRRANVSNSLRLDDFSLSASARLDNTVETPADTLPEQFQTDLSWQSSLDYQIDLMGSTTFKPSASLEGAAFASDGTGGDLLQTPMRMNFGASLGTDLYGFFPGVGPFSRIRHKLSPAVSWRYSPPINPQPGREEIPGYPSTATGRSRNVLNVSLSQTFEAKIGGDGGGGGTGADTAAVADSAVSDTAAAGGTGGQQQAQKVTLLSLRTSGLTFDFGQAPGEPVLTTDQIRSNVSSDLLRGLSFNITHDLFSGTGSDRTFDPVITRVGTSFSVRSGQGIGEILGLGLPGGEGGDEQEQERDRGRPGRQAGGEAGPGMGTRGSIFTQAEEGPVDTGAGPWNLSVSYSLYRPRSVGGPGVGGAENQTVSGNLRFEPTPNWEVDWRTSYNVTTGEFGSHQLRLTREIHRWRAEFNFSKAPNGNVRFDLMVSLTDAPEIKVPYQIQTRQQSRTPGGAR